MTGARAEPPDARRTGPPAAGGRPTAVPDGTRTAARHPGGRAVVAAVHTAAAALACWSLGQTLWAGLDRPAIALAFGVLIAAGELAACGPAPATGPGWAPDDRTAAPLGAAGALAYALLGEAGGRPTTHGVPQTVAVVLAAALIGAVPQVARGRRTAPDRLARRVLTTGFAATCFQPLYNTGTLGSWVANGPAYPFFLIGLLALTTLCDAVLAATLAHARTGWPYGPLLRDELRALPGMGTAVCATGVVIALATAVVGLWALPVFCLPLLLTQLAFGRFAAVRATYRQTIASLARATEIAGYTPHGHARRVAALSRAVGRELGLTEPDLDVLEYAALMHDIGQLSLLDPVPDGATAPLPPAEQRRIALLGGAVVRQTGVPAEVATIVERQADPYPDQPVTARIVRTVNAYDDLAGGAGGPGGRLRALERLRLATAHDHEPRVVEALARVLARGGREV
ncbi:lipoprotein [Streptomyces nigrescens]|uniref:Lipoprotein n=2 Tax=Streptomyces TaxID=1883 RepID=A0ABM8A167_STRNI|nr:HD domain-containing protein [Streptomyces nigrescens]MEE4424532.1 HD domain-containing protein [Streptomyces sp. DSM 41528]BDM72349.1 lipoprotein [Streptomyces nigrescens]